MVRGSIFHRASLGKCHHARNSQGLAAYRGPHFLVALRATGVWAVKIPPELTGNAVGQEARGFSQAARTAEGQHGSRGSMPGTRPLPGTDGLLQLDRGGGEGGLVPRGVSPGTRSLLLYPVLEGT